MGAKIWANSEIMQLLDVVDCVLPEVRDQWDRASIKYHENNRKWIRNGDICKNKFDKLSCAKKPTRTSKTPLSVLRTKEINKRHR